MKKQPIILDLTEKFWSNIKLVDSPKNVKGQCWIWTGKLDKNGYGKGLTSTIDSGIDTVNTISSLN